MNQWADVDQIWYTDFDYVSQDLIRLYLPAVKENNLISIISDLKDMQMIMK